MREHYQLLAFDSTHAAMAAARSLKTRLPVPVLPWELPVPLSVPEPLPRPHPFPQLSHRIHFRSL